MLYAFIGGDLRQNYLLKRFIADGRDCITYNLSSGNEPAVPEAASLKEALQSATHILCPIPFMNNNPIDAGTFPNMLSPGQIVYGGAIPNQLYQALTSRHIICYDYMKDMALTQFNTIATAEGILAEAITAYPGNIHDSNCLVLGFGRCGKVLSDRLLGLHAKVSVCVRKEAVLTEAYSLGYSGFLLTSLPEQIAGYDLIFNTIPSRILTAPVLCAVKPGSYIFDIASAPGGVDLDTAKTLPISAGLFPGLPGKYAPQASADALYHFIIQTSKSS